MSPKALKSELDWREKLALLPILIATLCSFVFAATTGFLVNGEHRPSTYSRYVLYSAIRTMFALSSSRQEQWFTSTTGDEYRMFCSKQGLSERTGVLSDSKTNLHWLGQKHAEYVLLYIHGGGYNLCARDLHFSLLNDLLNKVSLEGMSFAVAVIEYDLAPYAVYPRQLAQVALALNDLLKGRSASKIVLLGDSSAGHLVVDVLLHMLQRHPDASVPGVELANGTRLGATILASPWIDQSSRADSYRRNARKDLLSSVALARWAANFQGDKPIDEYLCPLTADPQLWRGLSDITERLYISSGSDEVFVDDIRAFRDIISKQWEGPADNLVYIEMVGKPHCPMLVERSFGAEDSEHEAVIRSWVKEAMSQ